MKETLIGVALIAPVWPCHHPMILSLSTRQDSTLTCRSVSCDAAYGHALKIAHIPDTHLGLRDRTVYDSQERGKAWPNSSSG